MKEETKDIMTALSLVAMFPKASKSFIEANAPLSLPSNPNKTRSTLPVGLRKAIHEANHQREIQDSEPKPDKTPALDSANEGKKEGVQCFGGRVKGCSARVRFTGFRVRPLDPDNFAGSVKDLLDGLRHAHLIEGDEWWRIELTTAQEKVKSYAEERTVIEIEW